jgi:hypothetical protein
MLWSLTLRTRVRGQLSVRVFLCCHRSLKDWFWNGDREHWTRCRRCAIGALRVLFQFRTKNLCRRKESSGISPVPWRVIVVSHSSDCYLSYFPSVLETKLPPSVSGHLTTLRGRWCSGTAAHMCWGSVWNVSMARNFMLAPLLRYLHVVAFCLLTVFFILRMASTTTRTWERKLSLSHSTRQYRSFYLDFILICAI